MSNFIDIFRRNRNISFVGMRDAALTLLPADRTSRNKLYQDLERGKGILDDEDHLNMYLHSFGKMHKAKLDAALVAFLIFLKSSQKKWRFTIGVAVKEQPQYAYWIFYIQRIYHLISSIFAW